jgi:uncharacterized membrane protein
VIAPSLSETSRSIPAIAFLSDRLRQHRWIVTIAAIFFGISIALLLNRYYSFYASYDQGIFNQVYWNSSHGRFFQSSLSSALSTNVIHQGAWPEVMYHRLGQHFTPALMIWLPIYALFPSPVTLSVLHLTLITLGGLMLYVLALRHVDRPLAGAIAATYYGANAVVGPTWGNFHDICQLPLFVFVALWAMETRRWWLYWLMAIAIVMVREDAGVSLFGIGAYLIVSRRHPGKGIATCVLAFGYMLVLTNVFMPFFSADISERFMMERFGQYATGDEATTIEIIWGILSNPFRLISELLTPFDRTIAYLLGQGLPLMFVPFASIASWTIAGVPLFKLLIAKGDSVLVINIRYAMTIVPGLFYGAILWWSSHQDQFKRRGVRRLWVGCVTLSLLFTVTSNPNRTLYFLIPDSFEPRVHVGLVQQWQHARAVHSVIDRVPDEASVAATTYIIPHLSSRREILRFPQYQLLTDRGTVEPTQFIALDLAQLVTYSAAFKVDRERLQTIVPFVDRLLETGEYGAIAFDDGAVLLQRETASDPAVLSAWMGYREAIAPVVTPG